MWLWRGETGLWEPDPATPLNFRGNLLGIAFDPNNPAHGYAVGYRAPSGQVGVLLRYGKTWTQERSAIPPQARGASFTSIAFAGSEAIVAYRQLPDRSTNRYVGGLLVNDGSGWHVDEGAAAAMGSNVPWAVAGLPDGGAAFTPKPSRTVACTSAKGPAPPGSRPPRRFPGGGEPGSLALFREGGALRAIAAGSAPDTYKVESETAPTAGLSAKPDPALPAGRKRGTGRAAPDRERLERRGARTEQRPGTAGELRLLRHGLPARPDLGGADRSDRRDRDGPSAASSTPKTPAGCSTPPTSSATRPTASTPPGVGASPVPTNSGEATFAIGGDAQCAAPCADRANARIGPDVWLSAALARAGQIPACGRSCTPARA